MDISPFRKRQDRFVLGSLTEPLLVDTIEKTSNLKVSLIINWGSRSLHMYLWTSYNHLGAFD